MKKYRIILSLITVLFGLLLFGCNNKLTVTTKKNNKTFNISYILNDGENDVKNPTEYATIDEIIELQPATKIGYDFIGWFDGNKIVNNLIVSSYESDIKLEAIFKPSEDTPYKIKHYFVTFDNERINGYINDNSNYAKEKMNSSDSVIAEIGPLDGMFLLLDFVAGLSSYKFLTKELVSEEVLYGKTNDEIKIIPKEYDGYYYYNSSVYNEDEDGGITYSYYTKNTISADGSTVVELYYTNQSNIPIAIDYTYNELALKNGHKIGGTINVNSFNYFDIGETIKLEATPYIGYEFAGWYINDELFDENNEIDFLVQKEYDYKLLLARFNIKNEMLNFDFDSNLTECTINSVYNKNIDSLVIPNYVTKIADGAFEYLINITSIELPDNFVSIGKNTFACCSRLNQIMIGNKVQTIEKYAFAFTSLTEIILSNNITRVEDYAFLSCNNLISVVLPKDIEYIRGNCFECCNDYLCIYFEGTKDDMNGSPIVLKTQLKESQKFYCYSENEPTEDGLFWHYVDGKPTPWE